MNCGPKMSKMLAFLQEQIVSIREKTYVVHSMLAFMYPNFAHLLLNISEVM